MGMYTEFYFRAGIEDGPVANWLERQINGEEWFEHIYDSHSFFTLPRWTSVFRGGGAVYQESRTPIFRRKSTSGGWPYGNELVLASSLKNYGGEIKSFMEWIGPHLDMHDGDYLGYSLYEDSTDGGEQWREHPTLYFHRRDAAHNA